MVSLQFQTNRRHNNMLPLQVFSIFVASAQAVQLYGPPKEATLLERPFQAAIFKNDAYRCSAAIISSFCVLTACSCIVDYSVQMGKTTELNDNYTLVTHITNLLTEQTNWADVTDVIIANGCDIRSNKNDAAVLCAKELLVGLPTEIVEEPTKENVRGIVSGWGLSVNDDDMVQGSLQRAYMKIISLQECRRRYAGVREVPDSALCALATDEVRGFCSGDFGAPLTHGEGLIGIAVSDFGCGQTKYPGIFTNVSMISTFIENAASDFEYQLELDSSSYESEDEIN